jgi:hypothetical protein
MAATRREQVRDHFLGWQCRIRQHAMRKEGGKPGTGMCPRVLSADGTEVAPALTVLIVERPPCESTAEFRHICKRTQDPRQRYEAAIKLLSSSYFQTPRAFSDVLTATFAPNSRVAADLISGRDCSLEFTQFSQRYHLPCSIVELQETNEAWQATWWHNAMFNPALPPDARLLQFQPDWLNAQAEPPIPGR